MRTLLATLLFYVCSLSVSSTTHAQSPTAKNASAEDAAAVEQRLRSSAAVVLDAVVRIEWGSKYARSGAIVTRDGYVVWPGTAEPDRELTVVLSSGESVAAKNCGWSTEWRVGLLKLDGDREWPHVEFGSTKQYAAGEPCFEIGYHASEREKGGFDRLPKVRYGTLSFVSPSHWFVTSLEHSPLEWGASTFDADGKLLGISVPGVSLKHQISTAAEIFTSYWEDLTSGKNLDWVRYPPSEDSLYRRLAAPGRLDRTGFLPRGDAPGWNERTGENLSPSGEEDFLAARKRAAATTVRIRRRQRDPRSTCWSGVLVSSEGHIATCAHTEQLAGEELLAILPDGREFLAVALGTNWVSDVGLVKITKEGKCDYAELGDSSIIGPDDRVLCAGFPVASIPPDQLVLCGDTKPLQSVTTVVVPLQRTSYVGWSAGLMAALHDELSAGASGGGIFDREGRLIAIYIGAGGGQRIEMFRAQEAYLRREAR